MKSPERGRFACAGVQTEVEYELLGDGVGLVQGDARQARSWRPGPADLYTQDGGRRPVILTLVSAEGRGYLFVCAMDNDPPVNSDPRADLP